MSRDGADGGFLARWSRRKQQARTGRPETDEALPETAPVEPGDEPQARPGDEVEEAGLSDAELLQKYELPDPETLTAADDVAAFMRKGVPARLRNLALRRLWRLDPVLANLDGLNDYDEDYTDAAMLVGAVKTVYQVGKGGAAHLQEAADRLAEQGTGPPPETQAETLPAKDAPAPDGDVHANVIAGDEGGRRPAADERGADEQAAPAAPDAPDSAPSQDAPRRRRMVFARPGGSTLHTD